MVIMLKYIYKYIKYGIFYQSKDLKLNFFVRFSKNQRQKISSLLIFFLSQAELNLSLAGCQRRNSQGKHFCHQKWFCPGNRGL